MDKLLTDTEVWQSFSRWGHFSRREKAFACWLLLRSGWRDVDLRDAARFDTDSNRVFVLNGRGDVTLAICRWSAEESLIAIQAGYGADARVRAEEVIDAPERREEAT